MSHAHTAYHTHPLTPTEKVRQFFCPVGAFKIIDSSIWGEQLIQIALTPHPLLTSMFYHGNLPTAHDD